MRRDLLILFFRELRKLPTVGSNRQPWRHNLHLHRSKHLWPTPLVLSSSSSSSFSSFSSCIITQVAAGWFFFASMTGGRCRRGFPAIVSVGHRRRKRRSFFNSKPPGFCAGGEASSLTLARQSAKSASPDAMRTASVHDKLNQRFNSSFAKVDSLTKIISCPAFHVFNS